MQYSHLQPTDWMKFAAPAITENYHQLRFRSSSTIMAMYPQIRVNESTKIIRTSTKNMGGNEVRIAEKRESIERYSELPR